MADTTSQLLEKIERLNIALGRPTKRFGEDKKTNVGHLFLEQARNGYCLVEIVNDVGGESHPLGYKRRSKDDLLDLLNIVYGVLFDGLLLKKQSE